MASPVTLIVASRVASTFQALRNRILAASEISALIRDNLARWSHTPDAGSLKVQAAITSGKLWAIRSATINSIVRSLLQHKIVQEVVLPFPYRTEHRFVVGHVSNLAIVQSLDKMGYFSHFTALHMNNLTEQIPKTIYFNVEQYSSGGGGTPTQTALDRAFKVQSRVSANVIEYKQVRIHRLAGRNTGQLGVVEARDGQSASSLRVTDIERTLIDATVRPVYSGGIAVVAKAFEMAVGRVSVKRIADYLRRLHYTYPYHQAIGYYLERAAYDAPQLALFRKFPIELDFYLAHGLKSLEYNKRWRLFVPKGF